MSATTPSEPFDGGRLPQAAAITAVAAVAVNLLIFLLTTAIVDVPDRFTPLQPGSVIFLTVIGVLAAAGVCRLLNGRSARPVAAFRQLVPLALVISLIPDVLIWATDGYEGAATADTVLPLMAMHVCAAAACWLLLPALAAPRTEGIRRETAPR